MAQFVVNSTSIDNIISSIKEGEIVIPEIQRPFVWDGTKVRDLLDSLYKGFPVGYIIIWKNPDLRLKDGKISSGKKILIDGQQRITAIQAAIVGQEVVDSTYKKKRIVINIKDKAPCEYMDRMKQQIDGNGSFYGGIVSMDDLQANLEENCIPECFMDMDVNDYKAFLAMRRKMIAQYIRNYYENLE